MLAFISETTVFILRKLDGGVSRLKCATDHGGQSFENYVKYMSQDYSVDRSIVRQSQTVSMKGETVVLFYSVGTKELQRMRGLDLMVILASAVKYFSVLIRMPSSRGFVNAVMRT